MKIRPTFRQHSVRSSLEGLFHELMEILHKYGEIGNTMLIEPRTMNGNTGPRIAPNIVPRLKALHETTIKTRREAEKIVLFRHRDMTPTQMDFGVVYVALLKTLAEMIHASLTLIQLVEKTDPASHRQFEAVAMRLEGRTREKNTLMKKAAERMKRMKKE